MPSKRYSLVRGLPPLMRGSGAAGGGGIATPGARLASVMKLRPLSGRSTILRLSTTCPSPELSPRRSEASATTVTASVTPPTSSCRSSRRGSPVASRMPSRVRGRNPSRSMRTRYASRRERGEHEETSSPDTAVRATPLSAAVIVTVAPGMATPAPSTTLPARVPPPISAAAAAVATATSTNPTRALSARPRPNPPSLEKKIRLYRGESQN